MITSLTPKQEELLSRWPELWHRVAFSCECVNLHRAKLAVRLIYEAVGFRPPDTFLVVDSPWSGAIMATVLRLGPQSSDRPQNVHLMEQLSRLRRRSEGFIVRQIDADTRREIVRRSFAQADALAVQEMVRAIDRQVPEVTKDHSVDAALNRVWGQMDRQLWPDVESRLSDQDRDRIEGEVRRELSAQVGRQLCGPHSSDSLAYYAYVLDVLGLQSAWFMKGLVRLARCCGWWAPYSKVAILQHRHCELHRNAAGRLHRDGGPALVYRDGFAVWALNGVRVPKWIAETRDTELDPRKLLTMRNVDVRREFVRKVGIDRVCYSLGATTVDKKGAYELLALKLSGMNRQIYLKMLNPSIGTWHVEGVDPTCRTVSEALAWRNGVSRAPAILT